MVSIIFYVKKSKMSSGRDDIPAPFSRFARKLAYTVREGKTVFAYASKSVTVIKTLDGCSVLFLDRHKNFKSQ